MTSTSVRYGKTSAPRSAVVHMVTTEPSSGIYMHQTACGTRIGDEWAGEYTEEPSGPVTCKRCLPHVARVEENVAALAVHKIGARVGVLVGQLSVNGPHVGERGTVTGHFTGWSYVQYLVRADGEDESYVYDSAFLVALPCDRPLFGGMTLDEIDADAAVSTGGMPLEDERPEVPTGSAEDVAHVSRQIMDALSPRSWDERGEDEARARSMAAHPAGKSRRMQEARVIAGEYVDGVRVLSRGYANAIVSLYPSSPFGL